MKINKKQWPVISNGIDRIVNLFSAVVEGLQTLTLEVQALAQHETEILERRVNCTECLYYCPPSQTETILGECRYNAPLQDSRLMNHGDSLESGFPVVGPEQWCGRFRGAK